MFCRVPHVHRSGRERHSSGSELQVWVDSAPLPQIFSPVDSNASFETHHSPSLAHHRACPAIGGYCAGGGSIVPSDGYWHSSPESEDFTKCVNRDACTFPRRVELLQAFHANVTNATGVATLGEAVAKGAFDFDAYQQLQCAEGYTGALCAKCARGYGRVR